MLLLFMNDCRRLYDAGGGDVVVGGSSSSDGVV